MSIQAGTRYTNTIDHPNPARQDQPADTTAQTPAAPAARFASPGSLRPLTPAVGDTVTIAGYGRTGTDWVPDRPHMASFAVQQVTGSTATVNGSTADTNLCKGDLGGPVLRGTAGGQPELVAIAAASFQNGCLGETDTRGGSAATLVTDFGKLFDGDPFSQLTLTPTDSGNAPVAGALFGATAVTADFNGDGFADVAVGAPGDQVNGQASGTVTVFINPPRYSRFASSASKTSTAVTNRRTPSAPRWHSAI